MHTLPMPIDPAEGLPSEHISGRTTGIDPHASVDDYNRVMLQYTQLQFEAFTREGDNILSRPNNSNNRSSGNSGQSNTSPVSNLAGAGTALPPQRTGRSTSTQSSEGRLVVNNVLPITSQPHIIVDQPSASSMHLTSYDIHHIREEGFKLRHQSG
ncbi:hypothetical protein EYB25_004631 [Talaromyces marneffei]|uniref:uncharacterized protein n=1 Tax=Talaromyces marneffei TaxID=37727 RepID=UPI0012A8A66E|nr:uncharacterized protein EYB26_004289 [Talaromyces marneffei]KAE8553249.1 hypothetical protein EYB25_004631 [Talaromyces marneffei]QGA16622.1 hypothetical protein EYB26_004289 [Talaromyces marneffei]